jgi:hypothetical protein
MTYFKDTFADGSPDYTNPHQPGYRFADTNDSDRLAADRAYRERTQRLSDAWRKSAAAADAPAQGADRAVADKAWLDKKERLQNSWKSR